MTNPQTPPSPLLGMHSGGMVTAIGNSMAQTASSWITQVRRMRRIQLDGFADPFTIADCETVTNDLTGPDRLIALLASAVTEAAVGLASLKLDKPTECLEILVLPSWLQQESCDQISDRLTEWLRPFEAWNACATQRNILRAGATGSWAALEYAYRAMEKNPNLQHVMIAAADTFCGPAFLRHAAEANWLMRPGNSQGYVPGEAAACLLLSRVKNIREIPADGFGLHRPAFAKASEPLWPSANHPDGAPLGTALTGALQNAGMQAMHISHLESDMDGSDWRAQIESSALNRVVFTETTALPQWRPTNLLGQTGAASGLLGWLLPAVLHARHIEPINSVLNWSVEPTGEIAACVLERSPK